MIPFASQRGLGQDLATHLLNAHDNEMVELAEVSGAIAGDLHGAFAEWEAQAHALTRCENYLYSLSVNPNPSQDPLNREQYFDYIDRVESKLGLSDQPRAVVFHEKYGREHCHVVWSRIDADNEKAVQIAFDRQKLMMVTREFARDHGLELPDGYFKDRDGKTNQHSLYEMHQERSTGFSKEQRMEQVTDAWRASDSPKAFVQALAEQGYILATGKRPFVLIDIYGNMNALPKLIDDKTVRTKDIRAFLDKDFPPESLPTVDEARALADRHRKEIEGYVRNEQQADALAELKRNQAERRKELEQAQTILSQKQHQDRVALAGNQKALRNSRRAAYLMQSRRLRKERDARKPSGLAGFLGKVSGVELLKKQLHKYEDRKRLQRYREEREVLTISQEREHKALKRRHEMQLLDLRRKIRALEKIEKRELKSLEETLRREARIQGRGSRDHLPSLAPVLKKSKEQSKEKARGAAREGREEFNVVASGTKPIDLKKEFDVVAGNEPVEEEDGDSGEAPKPASQSKIQRYRRSRKRDRDLDRGR
ncbi:MAG: relaxase/mobilization nuclease domain-containing protein [Candidatus Thiodiazotropha endolucinida]